MIVPMHWSTAVHGTGAEEEGASVHTDEAAAVALVEEMHTNDALRRRLAVIERILTPEQRAQLVGPSS